jgi:hypothetical protein
VVGAVGHVARHELGAGAGAGVGPVQAAGLVVGVERGRDAAGGEVLGGLLLPRLELAADGFEADARVGLEQAAVGVAGADRLELRGIAQEDDLGAGSPNGTLRGRCS